MSQIYRVIETGGAAGPILTLTGNSGGAIAPTAGNINVIFDPTQPGAGATSKTAGSTLTINSWIKTSATTNDDSTPVNLYALTLANNTAVTINLLINALSSDFTRSGAGAGRVGAVNNGGAVTIIGTPALSLVVDPNGNTAQLGVSISGTTVQIFAIGEAGVTYNWESLVYYVINS
jgi:hypothetical protein